MDRLPSAAGPCRLRTVSMFPQDRPDGNGPPTTGRPRRRNPRTPGAAAGRIWGGGRLTSALVDRVEDPAVLEVDRLGLPPPAELTDRHHRDALEPGVLGQRLVVARAVVVLADDVLGQRAVEEVEIAL